MIEIYGGNGKPIGNYIHYNPMFQLKFGISYPSTGNKFGTYGMLSALDYFNGVHNKMYNSALNLGKQKSAQDLEANLNFFHGVDENALPDNKLMEEEYREALLNSLIEQMGKYFKENLELDFDNLKTDYTEGNDPFYFKGGLGENYIPFKSKKVQGKVLYRKIDGLIKALEKNLQENEQNYKTRGVMTEYEKKRYEQAKKIYNQLKQEMENAFPDVENIPSMVNLKEGRKFTAQGKIAAHFNRLKAKFIFSQALAHGAIGEYMVPAILFALQQKSNEKIGEIMNDFAKAMKSGEKVVQGGNSYQITGSQATSKDLIRTNFAFKLDGLEKEVKASKDHLLYKEVDENSGNLIAVSATQDKVDAEITYNDEIFNLSIKNYNLGEGKKNITLLKGNVLRLIQHETDFINHYLNVTTTRPDLPEYMPNYLINKAHRTLKELLFVKALTGGVQYSGGFTNVANYFVVHDNSKGQFYVRDTGSIIQSALTDENYYNINYFKSLEKMRQDYYGDKNNPDPAAAFYRSYTLVKQLAGRSIEVHLNKKFLS